MRYSSLSEKGRRPNNEDVVFTRFDPRYPLIAAVSDQPHLHRSPGHVDQGTR